MAPTFIVYRKHLYNNKLFKLLVRFFRELTGVYQIGGNCLFLEYLFAIYKSIQRVVKEKKLKPADELMAGKKIILKPFGKQVIVDGRHFGLVREIFCSNCYFPPKSDFNIKATDTVVDLGCNVGIFTVFAAKIAKLVVAVDAQSVFLEDLKGNLSQNNCLHKVKIQIALVGSNCGLFSDGNLLQATSPDNVLPPKLSMDEICRIQQLDRIDFLKIDIEGSEFDLFFSNNSWLERVGKIAMEVHQEFGKLNPMVTVLRDLGFHVWFRDKNGIIVDELKDALGYLYAINKSEKTLYRSC